MRRARTLAQIEQVALTTSRRFTPLKVYECTFAAKALAMRDTSTADGIILPATCRHASTTEIILTAKLAGLDNLLVRVERKVSLINHRINVLGSCLRDIYQKW